MTFKWALMIKPILLPAVADSLAKGAAGNNEFAIMKVDQH